MWAAAARPTLVGMEESIVNASLLGAAFVLGGAVSARPVLVVLVAASGVAVAPTYWFLWSRENVGDWGTTPGEWLMGLVFGVPVLVGVWVLVVLVGFLTGRAVRSRLSAHQASRLSAFP
jgi:hypothetical protein